MNFSFSNSRRCIGLRVVAGGIRVHVAHSRLSTGSRLWRSRTSPAESDAIAIPAWSAGCGRLTENGRWVVYHRACATQCRRFVRERLQTAIAGRWTWSHVTCSSGILLRCVEEVESGFFQSGLRQSVYRPQLSTSPTGRVHGGVLLRPRWLSTTVTECWASRTPSTPCRSAVGPPTSTSMSTRAGCRDLYPDLVLVCSHVNCEHVDRLHLIRSTIISDKCGFNLWSISSQYHFHYERNRCIKI